MTITPAQRAALRLGAAMCLLGAVVLAVVAVMTDSGGEPAVAAVDDPASIALPDPGLFGSDVIVYGASERPGTPAADLGCRLLSSGGRELSSAKLSDLAVITADPVVVDGDRLAPLFEVRGYPDGAVLACSDADRVAPLAVSTPSTFGGAAGLVRATAAGGALVMLLVGAVGWLLLRPRRS